MVLTRVTVVTVTNITVTNITVTDAVTVTTVTDITVTDAVTIITVTNITVTDAVTVTTVTNITVTGAITVTPPRLQLAADARQQIRHVAAAAVARAPTCDVLQVEYHHAKFRAARVRASSPSPPNYNPC